MPREATMTPSESIAHAVLLFGAGASVATDPHVLPGRPPLGRELYDQLAEFAPGVWGQGSHLGQYADVFRNDFEAGMNDRLQQEPTPSVLEWLRYLAMYFAQFTLKEGGEDPYSNLIRRLHDRAVISASICASLNYECLLELAALSNGIDVSYEGRIDQGIEVLKPHGSCNFMTSDLSTYKYQLTNPGAQVGGGFEIVDLKAVEHTLGENRFSVTSMYAWGKNTPVGGTRLQQIRNRFNEAVRTASRLIIVGVRANAADSHLWIPITETHAELYFVGPARAHKDWLKASSSCTHLGERFEDSVDVIVDVVARR